MLASDPVTDARAILAEATAFTWTDADMLTFASQAERQVIALAPEAGTGTLSFTLAANTAVQALDPGTVVRLVKPVRNMGADGMTPGLEVTFADRDELQRWNRNWMLDTPAAAIRHVIYDPMIPLRFMTWPPPNAALYLELQVVKLAAQREALTDALSISAEYRNAMCSFIVFLCLSKLDEDAYSKLAGDWETRFYKSLDAENTADGIDRRDIQ